MKNVSVLSIVSFIVSFVSFLCWYLCVGYNPPTYELYVLTWYLWVICGCIAPVLPIAAKHYRKTNGINHTFYKFLEVIALFVGYFDIKSAAVLNSDFQYLGLCATAVSIICIYFYFRRSENSVASTPDAPAVDSKIETPPVAPVVVDSVKEVPTEKIVLDAPRKPADKKTIAIVCLTCALIISIGVIVYLGFFRPFAFYSSNGKYKKAVDIPIDCKDYMTDVEVTSYIYLDGSEKPIVYVKVILDDSISRLKPAERDSECNKTAAYVIQCIDDTLPESVVDTYCSNGRQYYYADIKIETSNEYIYHEEFRESMLKVKREG